MYIETTFSVSRGEVFKVFVEYRHPSFEELQRSFVEVDKRYRGAEFVTHKRLGVVPREAREVAFMLVELTKNVCSSEQDEEEEDDDDWMERAEGETRLEAEQMSALHELNPGETFFELFRPAEGIRPALYEEAFAFVSSCPERLKHGHRIPALGSTTRTLMQQPAGQPPTVEYWSPVLDYMNESARLRLQHHQIVHPISDSFLVVCERG